MISAIHGSRLAEAVEQVDVGGGAAAHEHLAAGGVGQRADLPTTALGIGARRLARVGDAEQRSTGRRRRGHLHAGHAGQRP